MKTTEKDIAVFASQVLGVARVIRDARDDRSFGDQVFIFPIRVALAPRMSKAMFDELLIEANRRGLIRMNRADLVAAMPEDMIAKSEVRYLNATFNLIEVG